MAQHKISLLTLSRHWTQRHDGFCASVGAYVRSELELREKNGDMAVA